MMEYEYETLPTHEQNTGSMKWQLQYFLSHIPLIDPSLLSMQIIRRMQRKNKYMHFLKREQ